jgi:hypothetical protein
MEFFAPIIRASVARIQPGKTRNSATGSEARRESVKCAARNARSADQAGADSAAALNGRIASAQWPQPSRLALRWTIASGSPMQCLASGPRTACEPWRRNNGWGGPARRWHAHEPSCRSNHAGPFVSRRHWPDFVRRNKNQPGWEIHGLIPRGGNGTADCKTVGVRHWRIRTRCPACRSRLTTPASSRQYSVSDCRDEQAWAASKTKRHGPLRTTRNDTSELARLQGCPVITVLRPVTILSHMSAGNVRSE